MEELLKESDGCSLGLGNVNIAYNVKAKRQGSNESSLT